MPPRFVTRRHPISQAEASNIRGDTTPSVADPIARVLDRMARAMECVTETTCCMEPELIGEEDRALERFLKFNLPKYHGKLNIAQEAENWIDQMENVFTVLKYKNVRQVYFISFRLLGSARDWWLRKKEKYETRQRVWTWTEFLTEFKKQFIPHWVLEQRARILYFTARKSNSRNVCSRIYSIGQILSGLSRG
jgi:hypothetical protein